MNVYLLRVDGCPKSVAQKQSKSIGRDGAAIILVIGGQNTMLTHCSNTNQTLDVLVIFLKIH